MKLWFENDSAAGTSGEATKVRNALRATVLFWAGFVFLFYGIGNSMKFFGALVMFGAIWASAKTVYHLATLITLRLPVDWRLPFQVLTAVAVAVLPLAYFIRTERAVEDFMGDALGWPITFTTAMVGYIVYAVANDFKPLVPIRAYLVATGVLTVFCWFTAVGGDFGGDYPASYEEGPLSDRELALRNYVMYTLAAFAGITLGLRKR